MKQFFAILSVVILLFLILSCSEDYLVEPNPPQADENLTSLSKLTTRLNYTGTENFDALSDPSCILDPGNVTPMGNKLIIKGFKISSTVTMQVEGMGVTQSQVILIMNAVWDKNTFSGPMSGTYLVTDIDGNPKWEGVYKGYRNKIGDNEWLGELDLKAFGVGDFEGMVNKATEKTISDMPMPMRYKGTIEGQIMFPNLPM